MLRETSNALIYVAPQRVEIRAVAMQLGCEQHHANTPAMNSDDQPATVRTLWSGISRGTERLVFINQIPSRERERMRSPLQIGSFPFPVGYGYSAVGVVEEGPEELVGRSVFALAPHMDRFSVDACWLRPLPDGLPERRAVLAANMETALNGVWDSGVGPCDRTLIVGGGVVGLLLAGLVAAIPGTRVCVVDPVEARGPIAQALGAAFSTPEAIGASDEIFDIAFHTSATAAGAQLAIDRLGQDGTLVELSWYGDGKVALELGGAFHSRRLRVISSQVGRVSPSRAPRWTNADRLDAALGLLRDPRYDALITDEVDFLALPQCMGDVLAPASEALATVVRYG